MQSMYRQVPKTRTVRHDYGSAWDLAEKWCAGSLWGSPIIMDGGNGDFHVHVYGVHRRSWTPVWLDINGYTVTVVLPAGAALAAAPRWISVTERLPGPRKPDDDLLALRKNGFRVEAMYDGSSWWEFDHELADWIPLVGVTHWYQVPAPEVKP